jgi:hypothetical protein
MKQQSRNRNIANRGPRGGSTQTQNTDQPRRGRQPGPDSVPYRIKCIVTGKELAVRPDVMRKRIQKAGSLEELQASYLSNEAKGLLRDGLTVNQIREKVRRKTPDVDVPTMNVDDIAKDYLANTTTPQHRPRQAGTVDEQEVTASFMEEATRKFQAAIAPTARRFAKRLVHA